MIGFGGLSLTQNGLGDISEAVFVSGNDRFFFIVHGRLPNIFVIMKMLMKQLILTLTLTFACLLAFPFQSYAQIIPEDEVGDEIIIINEDLFVNGPARDVVSISISATLFRLWSRSILIWTILSYMRYQMDGELFTTMGIW